MTDSINKDELLRFLRLLLSRSEPGAVPIVEIRILGALKNGKAVVAGYYDRDHLEKAVADVQTYARRWKGCYVTLNEINPVLLSRYANRLGEYAEKITDDVQIQRRRWMLIDTDPRRPAEISSSDVEHQAAIDKAWEIAKFLLTLGFPKPLVADSGNGGHLLYRLDLPNDDASRVLLQTGLQVLGSMFGTEMIDVDQTTFNAARISKLYGTLARKGDHTDARPHRLARVLHLPVAMESGVDEVVSVEALVGLGALAGESPHPPTPSPASQERGSQRVRGKRFASGVLLPLSCEAGEGVGGWGRMGASRPFDMEGFIRGHGLVTDAPEAYRGGMRWRMDCPFNGAHTNPDAALYVTAGGAAAFKCSHNSCRDNNWHALRDLLETPNSVATNPTPNTQSRYQKRKELDRKRELVGEYAVFADDLPNIETNNVHLRDITAKAIGALVAANEPPCVFVRSGQPIRITHGEDGVPSIGLHTNDTLRHRLARVANFVSTSEDRGTVPVAPPFGVVSDLLAAPAHDYLPPLETVVSSPVVAEDGSLVVTPGYVPEARVYYHEIDERLPGELSDTSPTVGNVRAAKSLLMDSLLGDFPFVDQSSATHALAALLQPFVRPCIDGNTPIYLIDAPTQGTGKSLLAETIAAVFLGRVPASTSCPDRRQDDEWRKLLTTALMDGPSHIWFDNLKYRLENPALAQALTSQSWHDRLLGGNTSVTLPVRCTWLLTANNIELDADFPRRSVWIRLDAKEERPENRAVSSFRITDLQRYVLEERPRIIGAVLTLLKAWLAAGRPAWTGQPIGSYTPWCRVMGGILDCIGIRGFLENRERLYAKADPERERQHQFVQAWWETHRDKPMTGAGLIEIAVECEIVADQERGSRNHFGRWLRSREEQVIGGFVVQNAGVKERAARYRLVPVNNAKVGQPFPVSSSVSVLSSSSAVNESESSESISPARGGVSHTHPRMQKETIPGVGVIDSLDSLSFTGAGEDERVGRGEGSGREGGRRGEVGDREIVTEEF